MKIHVRAPVPRRPVLLLAWLAMLIALLPARAVTWKRADGQLGLEMDGQMVWQFCFATNQGKPYFHPLRLLGGESLTAFKPADHPWHYALWFSWKYINGVNYWEEDKQTGRAQGATKWDSPKIQTHADGRAEIKMKLRYVFPTNGIVMMEDRVIRLSAPGPDGAITLDWAGTFTASGGALLLDRTPMPGEEHGAVNGGYAGFSLRAAQAPAQCQFVTIEGPVEQFASDRARPASQAAACNITLNGRTDGVAIFSHAGNTGGDATWYMINSAAMRWFSPALLAPAPRKVKAHERFVWKFRVKTQAGGWTPEQLRVANQDYNR